MKGDHPSATLLVIADHDGTHEMKCIANNAPTLLDQTQGVEDANSSGAAMDVQEKTAAPTTRKAYLPSAHHILPGIP